MPDPQAMPRVAGPPAMWPDTLPDPQEDGFICRAGERVEVADVLLGVTRLAVKARTAPMSWDFQVFLTQLEMEIFEGWYRNAIENQDGEFYAHWIGGSRVVAFASNYQLSPLGSGWILQATAIRTRIDNTICDAFLSSIFQNIYRADITHADRYTADLTSADRYVSNWDLHLIAANEC
jgi:hypothetical protein